MRATGPALAAALALLLTLPCGADAPRIYEDSAAWENPAVVGVRPDEMFPDAAFNGVFQSRSFFYTGRLDNGIVFIINLFHWTYSIFNQWGLTVLVTDAEGRVYKYEGSPVQTGTPAPPGGFGFHFGRTAFELEPGGCRVRIELKDFSCDLAVRAILPPWKPGDGWAQYSGNRDEFTRYASPAPWASVSGTMSVFGQTLDARGQCLWDACLTVQPLSRTNSLITVFRAFGEPGDAGGARTFVSAMVTWTSEKYGPLPVPMLLVGRDDMWVLTTKDFQMTAADWHTPSSPPFPYPRRYIVSGSGGGAALAGEFESARMYHAMDVFDSLTPLMRSVASLFLKRPVYYRMAGRFRGMLTTRDGEEIALDLPAAGEFVILK
jgi:hypothetical protein